MRRIIIAVLACIAACTKPNPNVCCVTDGQCADLGADELRPCAVGQACAADFTCVAAECTTSIDCTSPDAPICANGLCIGACTGDADCADVAGRTHCSPEGTCVGCLDGSQCTADAAICDPDTHACRGCERDDECASGVCIEADGVCAEQSAILWVRAFGNDSGSCTQAAPCRTLEYALSKVTATQNVIRVEGGMLAPVTSSIHVAQPVTFDASGTELPQPNASLFIVDSYAGIVTIEGFSLQGNASSPVIVVNASSALHLHAASLMNASVKVSGGTLELAHSTATGSNEAVQCTSGTVRIVSSTFADAYVDATSCNVSISRSAFNNQGACLAMTGGNQEVENNVFSVRYELTDAIYVRSAAPGSYFRFNTVVNTSGIASDGIALSCDGTIDVTSNIFAYASMHPMGPGGPAPPCPSAYSLFDSVAVESHRQGTGNRVGDGLTFFVDRSGGNYHLSASSPARDGAETGLPTLTDFDGRPRSSTPDMGAFEAP